MRPRLGSGTGPYRWNTRRAATPVLMALLLLVLSATPSQAAVRVKATGNNRFRPKRVEVAEGARVVWRSTSGTHTVTAYRGDWSKDSTIDEGETTSFTFNDPGRFRYRCEFHSTLSDGQCSGMCGVVVVG